MIITTEKLQTIISKKLSPWTKKKYVWYEDRPNLIGIRSSMMVPDAFNDVFCLVVKNGTDYILKQWMFTADPGLFYLNNPANAKGTAILVPDQYVDTWSLGLHQGKADHPALVQTAKVRVYRDSDKDSEFDMDDATIDTGMFGINIHRSNKNGVTPKVVNWSAGCQVFQIFTQHAEMLDFNKKVQKAVNNKFTYTLLLESDLK